jgi:hypothetical protein
MARVKVLRSSGTSQGSLIDAFALFTGIQSQGVTVFLVVISV